MGQDKPREPTASERSLAAFADGCEASEIKPAHYYRLMPQINEARAVIATWNKANGGTNA